VLERNAEPFHECPRFFRCALNQCPLDAAMMKRVILAADHDQQCKAQRAAREAIAAKYPGLLPTGGLTLREVARDKRRAAAKARFEALSPEQKAKLAEGAERLRQYRQAKAQKS
jgi:hypothetical protein